MGPNSYFNETCDPVDLTQCPGSRHYLDPCDCRKFYQCDPVQIRMFNLSCKLGEIFITEAVCGHPNNAICQTTYPWKRCNVTENRMNQLRLMCENNSENSSGQNTSSINVLLMQTLLPVLGVALVLIVFISWIYRNRKLRRKNEPQLPDTDDSHYSSLQEYNPDATILHNPIFNIDRTYDYVVTEPANITFERMNRQNGATQGMNTENEDGPYISVRQSDSTDRLSTMSQPSDDVRESADITVCRISDDSSYLSVRRSGSMYSLSIGINGPCPHRIILNTQKRFLPFPGERIPCTASWTI